MKSQPKASGPRHPDRTAIVILNWNQCAETLACVESVLSLEGSDWAAIVVDNGSTEPLLEPLRELLHARRVPFQVLDGGRRKAPASGALAALRLPENRGYAGGNNAGIEAALEWGFDWIMVVNNDVRLPPDSLQRLLAVARDSADVGLVGCRILARPEFGEREQYGGGRLLYALGVYLLWRWKGRSGVHDVNFVPGCAFLARAAALAQVGLLDERYYLYSEDIELSHRLLEHGWRLLVDLDAHVWHGFSVSLGGRRTPLYYYYVTRNTLLFIKERLQGMTRLLSRLAFLAQMAAHCVQWLATGRRDLVRATWRGFQDYRRQRYGPVLSKV
ncbi:MAG: glycosyltransferase family 2 protein [Chloroflexi bacterium]|nr:MAG: glycosyltransferase family 2 protein [Chloroflexota bacterium]TME18414.1 MAG: glycosyltransferase family 2 protein [Chloroflexota bacterium]